MTLELKWHPLDDADFRDWLEHDCDIDCNQFAYGVYDHQWLELYSMYEDEKDA